MRFGLDFLHKQEKPALPKVGRPEKDGVSTAKPHSGKKMGEAVPRTRHRRRPTSSPSTFCLRMGDTMARFSSIRRGPIHQGPSSSPVAFPSRRPSIDPKGSSRTPLSLRRARDGTSPRPLSSRRQHNLANPICAGKPRARNPKRCYGRWTPVPSIHLARSWMTSASTGFTSETYSTGVAVPVPGAKRWLRAG
jgi:hypothetical protein